VRELINSTGLVAIDPGALAEGGAMHEAGAPHSGLDLHLSADSGESAFYATAVFNIHRVHRGHYEEIRK
jgi:hypothetical protein